MLVHVRSSKLTFAGINFAHDCDEKNYILKILGLFLKVI